MKYEITTPGRHDSRVSMNATTATLADARRLAANLAKREGRPMLVERVTKTGNATIGTEPQMQKNMNLYLAPEQLTAHEANNKARPGETADMRRARVGQMAQSIQANGQEVPVLVVEVNQDDTTTYEYVDGGCRVEAIALLNEGGAGLEVWCSLVDPTEDLFKKAVTTNLHRTQNSLLDMAYIVTEVRERNGWKGKGGGQRVAEYLGIQASRVTEYEKVLRAPAAIREKIESGEISTLDVALRAIAVPEEAVERAAELAREEEAMRPSKKGKAAADGEKEQPKPKAAKPKIKAKHIAEAAREIGQAQPRAKSEIAEFFEAVTEAAYPKAAVAFCDYFVQKWMKGEGTDRRARELFDAAVGLKAASGAKPKVKKKVATAPKTANAHKASKVKAKK